jgi:hypothetical protein
VTTSGRERRPTGTDLHPVETAGDTTAPTDLALDAYERALEPKSLVILEGGHYAPYGKNLPQALGRPGIGLSLICDRYRVRSLLANE